MLATVTNQVEEEGFLKGFTSVLISINFHFLTSKVITSLEKSKKIFMENQ